MGKATLARVLLSHPRPSECFPVEAQCQSIDRIKPLTFGLLPLGFFPVLTRSRERDPRAFRKPLQRFRKRKSFDLLEKLEGIATLKQAPKQCQRPVSGSTLKEGVFS